MHNLKYIVIWNNVSPSWSLPHQGFLTLYYSKMTFYDPTKEVFSHNVFYPIKGSQKSFHKHSICHLRMLWISKCFESKILLFVKEINTGLLGNFLPNGNLLDWSKSKAFADKKNKKWLKKCFFLFREWTVENTVGKVENVGYQHCLLFPQCFQKGPFARL